jgi:hypothetical protein
VSLQPPQIGGTLDKIKAGTKAAFYIIRYPADKHHNKRGQTMKVINITINVSKDGHSYPGITIYPGVDLAIEQAPCLPIDQIVFVNADPDTLPTGVYVQGVTAADISDNANPHYLAIHTAV